MTDKKCREERAEDYIARVRKIRDRQMTKRLICTEIVFVAVILLLLFVLEVSPA